MKLFYIDPQSMINLAKYDYYLLHKNTMNIYYFCSKFYDYKINPDIKYFKVFAYNKINNVLLKALSYILSYFIIFLYILKYRPDIIHVQWVRIPRFDYFFYKLCRSLFRLKIVFTAHNILPHDTGDSYKNVYQKIYNLSNVIIVHSENTKKELLEKFIVEPHKVKVVKHGILPLDIDDQKYDSISCDLDKNYDLKGKIVFSSLGFQDYYKGIDILSDVWYKTKELNQNKNCVLVIAGKVSVDISQLSDFENVIIVDRRLSDEEFCYFLKNTSVCLLPYREISQSGVLLTAISENIPVVVSDKGGLAEPLNIAQIGWKISEPSFEKLRDMLFFISKNPSIIDAVKNNADNWDRVKQCYSWNEISKQTQSIYENLI